MNYRNGDLQTVVFQNGIFQNKTYSCFGHIELHGKKLLIVNLKFCLRSINTDKPRRDHGTLAKYENLDTLGWLGARFTQ